jgi:hypothetical protein
MEGRSSRLKGATKLMLYKCALVFFITATVGFCGLSRRWQSGQKYEVDKTSPNGVYRVKIELREDKKTGTRDYTERLKVQYFKKQELISANQWENSDQYEPSLREGLQSVEWVADNVLRIGRDRSDQSFNDELIVSNSTDVSLKYAEVDYGRYESFHCFDLPPRSQVTLRASPEFKPDHSSNYFLGYGGKAQNGKQFQGTLEVKQRKSPTDGPLKFQITINAKDLR